MKAMRRDLLLLATGLVCFVSGVGFAAGEAEPTECRKDEQFRKITISNGDPTGCSVWQARNNAEATTYFTAKKGTSGCKRAATKLRTNLESQGFSCVLITAKIREDRERLASTEKELVTVKELSSAKDRAAQKELNSLKEMSALKESAAQKELNAMRNRATTKTQELQATTPGSIVPMPRETTSTQTITETHHTGKQVLSGGLEFQTFNMKGRDPLTNGSANLVSSSLNPGAWLELRAPDTSLFLRGHADWVSLDADGTTGLNKSERFLWSASLGWDFQVASTFSIQPSVSYRRRLFPARTGSELTLEGASVPSLEIDGRWAFVAEPFYDLGVSGGGGVLFGTKTTLFEAKTGWMANGGLFLKVKQSPVPLILDLIVQRQVQDTTVSELATWQTTFMAGLYF